VKTSNLTRKIYVFLTTPGKVESRKEIARRYGVDAVSISDTGNDSESIQLFIYVIK
jgi:hypothetical protein